MRDVVGSAAATERISDALRRLLREANGQAMTVRDEVRIAGVIADVKVRQRYRNEGGRPLEARYVFPASTRAAVNALTMKIGERIVQAEIREKQAARRDYEGAKREGKSASLLEQQRPNVFQMSIANLMPGDDIEVELRYS